MLDKVKDAPGKTWIKPKSKIIYRFSENNTGPNNRQRSKDKY